MHVYNSYEVCAFTQRSEPYKISLTRVSCCTLTQGRVTHTVSGFHMPTFKKRTLGPGHHGAMATKICTI